MSLGSGEDGDGEAMTINLEGSNMTMELLPIAPEPKMVPVPDGTGNSGRSTAHDEDVAEMMKGAAIDAATDFERAAGSAAEGAIADADAAVDAAVAAADAVADVVAGDIGGAVDADGDQNAGNVIEAAAEAESADADGDADDAGAGDGNDDVSIRRRLTHSDDVSIPSAVYVSASGLDQYVPELQGEAGGGALQSVQQEKARALVGEDKRGLFQGKVGEVGEGMAALEGNYDYEGYGDYGAAGGYDYEGGDYGDLLSFEGGYDGDYSGSGSGGGPTIPAYESGYYDYNYGDNTDTDNTDWTPSYWYNYDYQDDDDGTSGVAGGVESPSLMAIDVKVLLTSADAAQACASAVSALIEAKSNTDKEEAKRFAVTLSATMQALYQEQKRRRDAHPDAITDESQTYFSPSLPSDVRGLSARAEAAPAIRSETHQQWDIDVHSLVTGAAKDGGGSEISVMSSGVEYDHGGSSAGVVIGVVAACAVVGAVGVLAVKRQAARATRSNPLHTSHPLHTCSMLTANSHPLPFWE
jgi:hypothetical protein